MDIVIVGALIVVLLFCLGFGWGDIALAGLAAVGLFIVLIGGFFAACLVMLMFSRRRSAVFVRFDEESRFPCAVYAIDGAEAVNIFPCEMIMRDKLYVPGKEIKLLYCRLNRSVIDRNALLTIIFGSVVFIPSAVYALLKVTEIVAEMSAV